MLSVIISKIVQRSKIVIIFFLSVISLSVVYGATISFKNRNINQRKIRKTNRIIGNHAKNQSFTKSNLNYLFDTKKERRPRKNKLNKSPQNRKDETDTNLIKIQSNLGNEIQLQKTNLLNPLMKDDGELHYLVREAVSLNNKFKEFSYSIYFKNGDKLQKKSILSQALNIFSIEAKKIEMKTNHNEKRKQFRTINSIINLLKKDIYIKDSKSMNRNFAKTIPKLLLAVAQLESLAFAADKQYPDDKLNDYSKELIAICFTDIYRWTRQANDSLEADFLSPSLSRRKYLKRLINTVCLQYDDTEKGIYSFSGRMGAYPCENGIYCEISVNKNGCINHLLYEFD